MLKFDGEKWELYRKKISYKAPYEFYTDDEVEIAEDWVDVRVETLDLDLEQLKRLEQVQYFENAGVDDLVDYILEGKIPLEDFGLKEKIIEEQIQDDKTQMVKSLTDFENASPEELDKLYFLKKIFKDGIFIEKNDLVEYKGGLYVALVDHVAMDIYPPDTTLTLYRVKRKGEAGEEGEPDPWVQPINAETAYQKGARVSHKGSIWVSIFQGANVWEPGEFDGWRMEPPVVEPEPPVEEEEPPVEGEEDGSGEVEPWRQPTGGDGRYVLGATVSHKGEIWVSVHGGLNVWEPGQYGWELKAAE